MATVDTNGIPQVFITIKEEVIPPLPSGPGVLGVIGKMEIFKDEVFTGSFSTYGQFKEKCIEKLTNPLAPNQQFKDVHELIGLIYEAFQNGLPQLRVLFTKADPDFDQFRALYPEVDLVTSNVNIGIYLETCKNESIPCLAFLKKLADSKPDSGIVYVEPQKALGAVIGKVASLPYYEAPTFKPGLDFYDEKPLTSTEMDKFLKATPAVLPVSKLPNRGWCIVKGITSDKGEISVRRIIHYITRGIKSIGDSFLGQMNTENGRSCLREKIVEFLTRLTKDDILVPMLDPDTGKMKPAFKVMVSSSPSDFSLGLVRVDLEVRPVRAINYIDVMINVQAK